MAAGSLPSLVIILLLSTAVLRYVQSCSHSGHLTSTRGKCNEHKGAECCKAGNKYPRYRCSPPVTAATNAHMTIYDFSEGGDGAAPSKCDGEYHSDHEMIVALSTGWYNDSSRCGKSVRIDANGRSVLAKVVDECDSMLRIDSWNNIVDASQGVWKALGIYKSPDGDYQITWSDA
ncbi:hypothetical protein OPV22_002322 [Ensete ventricosum]|uniref:Ripening-related protein 2 n=1 Tax=Ensete ventricosum TaxID=4639 RepID=A0AAV8RXM1_ENSVE|nr:hypothetical protein OPV22_002322 [Ensete ventricosum]